VNAVQGLPARRSGRIGRRWQEASFGERLRWGAWGAVAILALLYVISWLTHLHSTIDALLWNSDYAGGFTLPETIVRFGTGGNTVISTTGAWADLWFGLLTAHLSFHRQLWEITPTLLFLVCVSAIGFGVWRLAGPAAAIVAAAIVFVASPFALAILMAPVAHNTVYPSTAIIGALLPWALARAWSSPPRWVATIVLGALLLGVDIASDKLLLVTAVIPAAVLAAVMLVRRPARAAAIGVLATIVLSAPVALATDAFMKAAGYRITAPKLELAPLSTVGFHFRLLWHGLRDLSGGYLDSGYPGTLHHALGLACTVVLALGLTCLAWAGAQAARGLIRRRATDELELERLVHMGYWFVSAIVVAATFVFTTAVGDGAGNHESYFLTIVFSVAATAPFAVGRGAVLRWAAPVAVGLFAVGSLVASQGSYNNAYRGPVSTVAGQIVQLARANHVTGSDICPFFLMRTPAWYRPQPGPSFLLVDPSNLYVTSLPDNLGPPLHTYPLGPVTMYVFPYDIASKLGPYPGLAPA
jgi:hypothetical protein